MPRTMRTRIFAAIAASVALLGSTPALAVADGSPSGNPTHQVGPQVDDETTPSRPISVYPTTDLAGGRRTPLFCIGGIGGDCDEWYTNPYGHKVLVTDEVNDYIKNKHGISKGMIRWSIENGRSDASIAVGTFTRHGYRTVVRRMDCDPTCHDAGVRVDVISIVDWAGYGTNKGALVTQFCQGYSGLCPKWIRAL